MLIPIRRKLLDMKLGRAQYPPWLLRPRRPRNGRLAVTSTADIGYILAVPPRRPRQRILDVIPAHARKGVILLVIDVVGVALDNLRLGFGFGVWRAHCAVEFVRGGFAALAGAVADDDVEEGC